jgi:hypothetical protein
VTRRRTLKAEAAAGVTAALRWRDRCSRTPAEELSTKCFNSETGSIADEYSSLRWRKFVAVLMPDTALAVANNSGIWMMPSRVLRVALVLMCNSSRSPLSGPWMGRSGKAGRRPRAAFDVRESSCLNLMK